MENIEKQLLQKFLDGRCTEAEFRKVQLLLMSGEGRALFDKLVRKRETLAWNNPPKASNFMQGHVQGKQLEMQQRIAAYEGRRLPLPAKVKQRKQLRYAAVWPGVLLIIGIVLWQFTRNNLPETAETHYVELTNPAGLPLQRILPDSTVIYLAGGSTLKYPETFLKTGRNVQLSGEAFFEVKRDTVHPFAIRSGNIETRVLGTSFKITAFGEQEQEVAVATGQVSVSSIDKNGKKTRLSLLSRGLKITYDPKTGEAKEGEADVYSLGQWKNGEFTVNGQPMKLVAKQLEGRYDARFVFADTDVADRRVSGTFSPSEPVAGILDMLAFVGKFRYENNGENTFIIYKTD